MADLIYSLFARGWRTQLGVPTAVSLDRSGVRAVLGPVIALPELTDETWARVRALAAVVSVEREGWQRVDCVVGPGAASAVLEIERFAGGARRDRCSRCGVDVICPHIVALLLAMAYADDGLRPRLLEAPWHHFLSPLMRADGGSPGPAVPRPGWLRAVLHAEPSDAPDAVLAGRLTVWLMHRSKNGNALLKPRACPRSVDALDRAVSGLRPNERALVAGIEDLHTLLTVRSGYGTRDIPGQGLPAARDRCRAGIMALLADVTELYLDDRPIAFDPAPWRPQLVALDGLDGGLALDWASRPQLVIAVEPDYVVIDDHLRPVDPAVDRAVLAMAQSDPPPIPKGDVGRFVDLMVIRPPAHVPPVELKTSALPTESVPPVPRLVLTADDRALCVELRFAYGASECGPDGADLVSDPFAEPPRLIRRDRAAEAAHWRRLAPWVPELPESAVGLTLTGDAAFDFLRSALDALDGFEVVTDASLDLARWRPQGTIAPRANLKADFDWFDLDVHFECGGRSVSAAAVLESWRAGRRYMRLDDGGVALLPDAWLARHGPTLGELGELRQRHRRVGVFAAPVVTELLDEVGLEAATAGEVVERLRAMARQINAFDGIPDRAVPDGLQATLRDYQHRGYRWMRALADLGLSGVLADDMGLGKTVQTLAALLDAHRGGSAGGPSLVVAPTSVIHNWVLEARRFAPELDVALYYGPNRGAPPTGVDLVITSYALMRLDRAALAAIEWRYVVLDEAQLIKNPASKTARAARSLTARHRLALSGTPLENHLIELWSLFEFVMPGFFGSRDAFRRRYIDPIEKGADPARRDAALDRLRQRIRPFVLRRLKREVATELPPRQEQILWCDLGRAERRLYDAVKETYRSTVMDRVDDVGVARSTIVILEALTRLRQAACDASLLPFPEARGVRQSAKRARVLETLGTLAAGGHRALVFSQWPTLLKRVGDDLRGAGIVYQYLDGSTRDRGDLQAQWNAPDGPPVFLISLKAGGTGLNLIGADVVIHLDPWWNPQTEQQATDRAHRIGQTRPVMVYKLVARDTVEEKVLELQARKRALFEAAVDGGRVTVDALTRGDLEAVFQSDEVDASRLASAASQPSPHV